MEPRRIDKELMSSGYSRSWSKSVRDMAEFLDDLENESIPKYKRHEAAQLRKRIESYITHLKARSESANELARPKPTAD